MEKKTDCIWLVASCVSFLLMSVSFLLMASDNAVCSLIAGIIFWAFFLLGIAFQIVLKVRFQRGCAKNKVWRLQKQKIGLLAVGKNTVAKVVDISFIVGVIGFVIAVTLTDGTAYACYILLAIAVYAFCMHCIVNGKVYSYIFNQKKEIKKDDERKDVN